MDISIDSFAVTHTGKVRSRNEDSILDLGNENLWVVADGMGGHDAGDYASQSIIKHLSDFKLQASLSQCIDLIEEKVFAANADIQQHAIKTKVDKTKTCGSTVVGLFIWQKIGIVFWSGDSRLYRYRNALERLSQDHSYVGELVRMGQLSADEAETHPSSNIILNAIGIRATTFLDLDFFSIQDNDTYILCSDGLYGDVREQDLSDTIKNEPQQMEFLASQLLEQSLQAGGSDNISIICINTQFNEARHV